MTSQLRSTRLAVLRLATVLLGALPLLAVGAVGAEAAASTTASVLPVAMYDSPSTEGGDDQVAFDPSGDAWLVYYLQGEDGSAIANVSSVQHQQTLAGGLKHPVSLGFDATGYAYVLAQETGSAGGPQIDVYAPGASGSTAPARVIKGLSTQVTASASSLAVGRDGSVYVATPNKVLVFAPGAAGNTRPVRTIAGTATALPWTFKLAAGTDGTVYVGTPGKVMVFAPKVTGNVAPTRVITGSATGLPTSASASSAAPVLFSVDNFANVYVLGSDGILRVFDRTQTGNVAPVSTRQLQYDLADNTLNVAYPQWVGVRRDRQVFVGAVAAAPVVLQYAPMVAKHQVTSTVLGFIAPTTNRYGGVAVAYRATGSGGYLAGNARAVLTAKGQATQTLTATLTGGGGEPSTAVAGFLLPKLPAGTWTLTFAYGGNDDFAPNSISTTFTVSGG